jgi:hypothetical protein
MTEIDTEQKRRSLAVLTRARKSFSLTWKFSKIDREKERNLYRQKWFDYRFISPTDATARFYILYQEVYRWKYRININAPDAEKKTGVSKQHAWSAMTSFWRARQFADELGVTYDVFLDAAFQVCVRRGWSRLPHINQLYGNKNRDAIANAVRTLWAEEIDSRFTISVLPQYREDSFCGLSAQIDHRDWVMDQIKARNNSPLDIGRACYVHKVVPEKMALLEYGPEKLVQARAEVASECLVSEARSVAGPPLPSCFGLPDAPDVNGEMSQLSCVAVVFGCGEICARQDTREMWM